MYLKTNLPYKMVLIVAALLLSLITVQAQLATYTLRTGGTNPQPGTSLASGTSPNVITDTITVGSQITTNPVGSYNSSGLRIRLDTAKKWPNTPTNGYHFDVPIGTQPNYNYTVTGITFIINAVGSSEVFWVIPMVQIDGAGTWQTLGTAQSCSTKVTVDFGVLNQEVYRGHSAVFRVYFYGTNTTKGQEIRINTLIFKGMPTTIPTVHTTSIAPQATVGANFSADIAGTYSSSASIQTTNQSGFCWASSPTIPTIVNNPSIVSGINSSGTTTMNYTISPLSVGTVYNARAYVITATDTIYGEILNVKAQDIPTVTTDTIKNILSTKATSGGVIVDSGSLSILEKGICWTLSPNVPTYTNTHTSDGVGSNSYASLMKNLLPNTTYCVRAYAKNNIGIGYGNQLCFTTAPPAPTITVNPARLDFGNLIFNTAAPILSYKINAINLTPAPGNITLTATNGYTISTKYNGIYTTSLPVTYINNTIVNGIVYVKSPSTPYGPLTGMVLHSGGGTVVPNADTAFMNTTVIQNHDTLSNAGSDFWCGFGYQARMKQKAGDITEAKMSIYIATGSQPATVHVELASGGYNQTFTIPANSIHEFNNFPTGDNGSPNINAKRLPDSRLYVTGITKKGIHIYTDNDVPVSAFMHTYTEGNTAAGAMLFPSNTWNSSYTVQAFGGKVNNGDAPNSFFFVVANQDSTPVTFTPKNDVIDSNANTVFKSNSQASDVKYKKDSTYTVMLNKGEIFNAIGFIQGNGSNTALGLDLSGSTVKTTCDKKIAVFGGNGRCFVNTPVCPNAATGSDHLIQQMFPSVAWGTKYLTMPTRGGGSNYYRIFIQDPVLYGTTTVWVNNPAHTTPLVGLVNNLYYEYISNQPLLIESNKPVNVSQFMTTPYCTTPSVDGGPEMIILSPVQQSITNAIVYSPVGRDNASVQATSTFGNHASFINIILPTDAVATFKLDNTNLVDTGSALGGGCPQSSSGNCPALYAKGTLVPTAVAFKKHPQDTAYSIASFWVIAPATHSLSAAKGFNAIAYGLGNGESYGYNAGTTINNLSAIKFSLNPYGTDTSTGSVKTCKDNLVTLQIALPYDTSTVNNIIWDAGIDPSISPNGPQMGTINPTTLKPLVIGTIIRDGRTFYIYKSPVQYQFTEEGAFKIKITINGTFNSDCGGTDIQYMNVIVGHDDIAFTAIPAGCGSKNVQFTDASTPLAGTTLVKWIWDFGDGKKDTVLAGASSNPTLNPHTYPLNNSYNIKLTTINSAGCFTTDTTHSVDLAFAISSTFIMAQDTICPSGSGVFTPTSSANAAKWFWDFGDGTIDSSNTTAATVSHIYTTSKNYIVTHWVKTAAGCPSTFVTDTINVTHQPIADFILPAGACLPGVTLFTNISDTNFLAVTMPYTYHWDFGDAGNADTSNLKNGSYQYPNQPLPSGGYPVSLTATNRFGCVSAVNTKPLTNVYPKPSAAILNTSDKKACVGTNANFFDGSTATNQTINAWHWNFGYGVGTSIQKNPQYPFTQNKLYTVTLYVETAEGCRSDTAKWIIKVNPKPVANTILPSSCFSSGGLFFTDNSTVAADDSVQTNYTYTWSFGDGSGTFTTKDSTHTYAGAGTYIINHSITTVNGCTDTKVDTFKIESSKPVPRIYIDNFKELCATETIVLHDSSRISIGSITRVEINWDYNNTLSLNAPNEVDLSPSNGSPNSSKIYTHKYPRLAGSPYLVVLYAFANNSCYDSTNPSPVNVRKVPIAKFDDLPGVCVDGSPKYIKLAYDSTNLVAALIKSITYSGTGIGSDTLFHPDIAGAGLHQIKVVYETTIPINRPCKDSAYANIRVWALPTVKFDTSLIKCEKTGVQFFDKSIADPITSGIKSWLWNFGDSGKDTIKNPTHTYTTYGNYNITLKVTSDSGCTNTLTPQTMTINPNPIAAFIPPGGACVGSPVTFVNNSTIADGTAINSNWSFGDPNSFPNNTSTATSPSHYYSGGPTDSIRLHITSINGCTDSIVKVVNNAITFPQITPTYKINGVLKDTNEVVRTCLGTALNFATGFKANAYSWQFGDTIGNIYTSAILNHNYPAAAIYKGSFSMIDSNGCETKPVPFNIQIWALPNPAIKIDAPYCEKNDINFHNVSTVGAGTGGVNTLLWNFGDGATATSTDPIHKYNNTGKYYITLKVTSDSGCTATALVDSITVHPLPKVKFSVPTSICLPNASAIFNDLSTIADGTDTAFTQTWNFGDPASGTLNTTSGKQKTSVTHIYDSSKLYTIWLYVTSKDGCVDSNKNTIDATIIHPQPTTDYTVSSNGVTLDKDTPRICVSHNINFKDISSNMKESHWTWGDGSPDDIGINQSHYLFNTAGSYAGTHYIKDNFNCESNHLGFNVMIDDIPTITDGKQYILEGRTAMLTPQITGAATVLWTIVYPNNSLQNYLDAVDTETPFCTPLVDSIVYKIDVASEAGCTPNIDHYYTVIRFHAPTIPNAFSPNGDRVNDTWDLSSLTHFTGSTVQVFNRYGQVVLNRFAKAWDGNDINGNPLPMGTYYYIIKPGLGYPMMSGSVTILR